MQNILDRDLKQLHFFADLNQVVEDLQSPKRRTRSIVEKNQSRQIIKCRRFIS